MIISSLVLKSDSSASGSSIPSSSSSNAAVSGAEPVALFRRLADPAMKTQQSLIGDLSCLYEVQRRFAGMRDGAQNRRGK